MEVFYDFLGGTLGAPLAGATAFFAMTLSALGLLAKDRKDDIALWLMGGDSEENWSKTFLSLFDALFGENHLSFRCIIRSSIASLLAVSGIWGLMIWSGTLTRVDLQEMTLGKALAAGIAVNLVADYVSLLETRWLLGRLPKIRSGLLHALILLVDLIVTAVLILAAIWAFRASGLLPDDDTDWLAITLAFSVYSAPFYSTFLTSVWTWAYILSTWILRLATRIRLAHWLDVENRPTLILSLILSVLVFAGASAFGVTLEKDEKTGLSALDSAVCRTFKGEICLRMIGIADKEETQLLLQVNACEGGVTKTCLEDALKDTELNPGRAARLFGAACEGGELRSCSNYGLHLEKGSGVPKDIQRAVELYRRGCDGDAPIGCYFLAFNYDEGVGVEVDVRQAAEYFRKSCDLGHMSGCVNLAARYRDGLGVERDPSKAILNYSRSCQGGIALGCVNLGYLYEKGIGTTVNYSRAAENYRRGCRDDIAVGCPYLGGLAERGLGVPRDLAQAAELYGRACDNEVALGCNRLGALVETRQWVQVDPVRVAELYEKGCTAEYAPSCINLGRLYENGLGEFGPNVKWDLEQAAEFYRKGCDLGDPDGCARLGDLFYYDRLSFVANYWRAAAMYARACDLGAEVYCPALSFGLADSLEPIVDSVRRTMRGACEDDSQTDCSAVPVPVPGTAN